MAPSISKEELMRNTDALIWNLSGGNSPDINEQRTCDKVWAAANSKFCNIVIVILVFAEGLVIISELLIDLKVVQDPTWPQKTNCEQYNITQGLLSPKLQTAKSAFSYFSIVILTLFIVEIIIKITSGRTRFIIQGCEIFDAIVVLLAFGFDVTFQFMPAQEGAGKEAAILIILLRLWRIRKIVQSAVDATKSKMDNVVNICQREKAQADNKVDLLILKLEDLEHEVAYLKEKLKKTEKECLYIKRRRTRDNPFGHSKPTSISIAIEASHLSTATQTPLEEDIWWDVVDSKTIDYAAQIANAIVLEALELVLYHLSSPTTNNNGGKSRAVKLKRRPDGSVESGYGSNASGIDWHRIRAQIRTEEKPPLQNGIKVDIHCSQGSPESGYGSGGLGHHRRTSSTSPMDTESEATTGSSSDSAKHNDSVFLFPETYYLGFGKGHVVELDELSEIERIKHIEFDPNREEKDIPMTSL